MNDDSTGDVISYALYIDACGDDAHGGGGSITSWGIYEATQVRNALYGNTRIGSTVAPTVALDVTGETKVSGLAGGGDRYVYADNNGQLVAGVAYP